MNLSTILPPSTTEWTVSENGTITVTKEQYQTATARLERIRHSVARIQAAVEEGKWNNMGVYLMDVMDRKDEQMTMCLMVKTIYEQQEELAWKELELQARN